MHKNWGLNPLFSGTQTMSVVMSVWRWVTLRWLGNSKYLRIAPSEPLDRGTVSPCLHPVFDSNQFYFLLRWNYMPKTSSFVGGPPTVGFIWFPSFSGKLWDWEDSKNYKSPIKIKTISYPYGEYSWLSSITLFINMKIIAWKLGWFRCLHSGNQRIWNVACWKISHWPFCQLSSVQKLFVIPWSTGCWK